MPISKGEKPVLERVGPLFSFDVGCSELDVPGGYVGCEQVNIIAVEKRVGNMGTSRWLDIPPTLFSIRVGRIAWTRHRSRPGRGCTQSVPAAVRNPISFPLMVDALDASVIRNVVVAGG